MRKSKFGMLLLLLPAVYTALEAVFLIKDTGYYKVDGIVGIVPLVLAFVCAAVAFKGTGSAVVGLCHYNPLSGIIFLLAAAGSLLAALSQKNQLQALISTGGISRALAYLLVFISSTVTICFIIFALCHFSKRHISAGILVIPAAISILLGVVFTFVNDPVNSSCSFAQKKILSAALLAIFLIKLFYQYSSANELCISRQSARLAAAVLAYCLPSLISAALLGGRILDLLPSLLYTFLIIPCLNFKEYSEPENE